MGLTLSAHHRDLLRVLSAEELCLLERSLCTAEPEHPCGPASSPAWGAAVPTADPPASWGLLGAPCATPLPPTCAMRLGPSGTADNLDADRLWGCVAGREWARMADPPLLARGLFVPPQG